MGQLVQTEDRLRILEQTYTDVINNLWTKNRELERQLDLLADRLKQVKRELENDLQNVQKQLQQHERFGDYCPHTGR